MTHTQHTPDNDGTNDVSASDAGVNDADTTDTPDNVEDGVGTPDNAGDGAEDTDSAEDTDTDPEFAGFAESFPSFPDDDVDFNTPDIHDDKKSHTMKKGNVTAGKKESDTCASNTTNNTVRGVELTREIKRFRRLDLHMNAPIEVITKSCIEDYFAHDYYEPGADIHNPHDRIVRDDAPQTTEALMTALLGSCNEMIRLHNAAVRNWLKARDEKPLSGEIYPMLKKFSQYDLVTIIRATAIVVNIAPADLSSPTDLDLLSYYDDDPTSLSYGTYVPSEIEIEALVQSYCYNITRKELDDVLASLKRTCTRVTRAHNKDLLAVNNGIYNYKTKKLMPFDPKYVFVSKSHVNYRPDAKNPIKVSSDGYEWNIEDWMLELTDGDQELTETLWQIIGATLRPYVSWNKSAWFYSETGNNGKGTLLEMMRNLCGPQTYASIPLADFGKEFMLEPLTRASAILVDENDVGTYIDKAANLKAIVTNDTISINRKYRSPIAYQFYGFMVQCLNEYPKVKDRSESFYRRQLFIPFNACFTGKERRYIKDDYMSSDDVLEYVLWRVLEGMDDYYVLNEPEAARRVLDDYKVSNDPVREFWGELREEFVWDLLPNAFLYDLYKQWHARNISYASPMGRNNFLKALNQLVIKDPEWTTPDNEQGKVRTGSKMDKPEFLIRTYDLRNWTNNAVNKRNDAHWVPPYKASYNGIVRSSAMVDPDDDADSASRVMPNPTVTQAVNTQVTHADSNTNNNADNTAQQDSTTQQENPVQQNNATQHNTTVQQDATPAEHNSATHNTADNPHQATPQPASQTAPQSPVTPTPPADANTTQHNTHNTTGKQGHRTPTVSAASGAGDGGEHGHAPDGEHGAPSQDHE